MSDIFQKLEKGHEAKYKMDEERQFKAHARRNKLLGLWAAHRLGLGEVAAAQYAEAIVRLDFDRAGDENVVEKIAADFDAAQRPMGIDAIYQQMDRLYVQAVDEVANEFPTPLDHDYSPVGG